jgi:PqqD family protein of HPr-rel-A system
MEQTWSAQSDRGILQRTWDGEAVIYDPVAGSTHYLDSISAAVLGSLSTEPASAESIARSLLADFNADSVADVLAAVQAALAKLRQMGLIQPADV